MPVDTTHSDKQNDNSVGSPNSTLTLEFDDDCHIRWHEVSLDQWLMQLDSLRQSEIQPQERVYWMSAMRKWLDEHGVSGAGGTAKYRATIEAVLLCMCEVAYKLCDWPLIIDIYRLLQAFERNLDALPPEQLMIEQLQIAVAYWQMGQLEQAESFLLQRLSGKGEGHPLSQFLRQVKSDLAAMPFAQKDRESGELLLMPLEEQHLSGFSWIYDDTQIAQLCNLPTFDSDQQWFDWLAQDQSNPEKRVFAVLHKNWGMIGCVSIEVHEGVGYFYYWLGADFQGSGYGPQAVDLMLTLAGKYFGLDSCYAKVLESNIASQKALLKLGFVSLPFTLAAPFEHQRYFYRGPDRPGDSLANELRQLMRRVDCDKTLLT